MANLRRRKPQHDGITVRQKSRALFQQHRPIAEIGESETSNVGALALLSWVASDRAVPSMRISISALTIKAGA
jgi:hypothetical protein